MHVSIKYALIPTSKKNAIEEYFGKILRSAIKTTEVEEEKSNEKNAKKESANQMTPMKKRVIEWRSGSK